MTAHGIYQFYVNGVRYDNREFAPENTFYHKLLQYQTYDITPLLQMGKNVFGIIIGDGWWCGRVGQQVIVVNMEINLDYYLKVLLPIMMVLNKLLLVVKGNQ